MLNLDLVLHRIAVQMWILFKRRLQRFYLSLVIGMNLRKKNGGGVGKHPKNPLIWYQRQQIHLCLFCFLQNTCFSSSNGLFVNKPTLFGECSNKFVLMKHCKCTSHHSSPHLVLCVIISGLCAAPQPWNPFHEDPAAQFLCSCCFQRQFGAL